MSQDASLHGIVSALAAVWPSLPALLLSGAVQRLCSKSHNQQFADDQLALLTAVIKALLQRHSMLDAQQQSSQKKRRGKRKSTGSDAEPVTAADRPVWCASAAQLKACIADCLQAQPRAEGERAAALRKVLLLLVQHMQEQHAAEYNSWGSSAEQLVNLMPPTSHAELSQSARETSQKAAADTKSSPALAGSGSQDTVEACTKQKQMLHDLEAQDEPSPKASRSVSRSTFKQGALVRLWACVSPNETTHRSQTCRCSLLIELLNFSVFSSKPALSTL